MEMKTKGLHKQVYQIVCTCRECQICKKVCKKYMKLPIKEAEPPVPWNRVNVDMIGPYRIKMQNKDLELRALTITMIDPATGWFEVKDLKSATASKCMSAFDDTWLSRYPQSEFIGFDNGNEYRGVFAEMCNNYGIKKKISTTYNPQSNGIIERVHQVLNDSQRVPTEL